MGDSRRDLRTLDAAEDSRITFLCRREDWGVIPKPDRAERYLKEKYRNPAYDRPLATELRRSLDSLPSGREFSDGWIVSVPGEFEIEVSESGVSTVQTSFGDDAYLETFTTGGEETEFQVCAEVHTRWAVDLPEGYGLLCLPPTAVDTDSDFSVISRLYDPNVSQRWLRVPITATERTYVRYGTPLAQVLPIEMEDLDRIASVE